MLYDKKILDNLSEQAATNVRLRCALDLRTSEQDTSQRILNALSPGTIIPIHRHPDTTETMIVIRGSVREKLYDEKGNLTDSFVISATDHVVLQIPAGQFHTLECLEPGTVIFEAKDGSYAPMNPKDLIESEVK